MVFITSHGWVTLVDHHSHHAFAISTDGDVVEAPTPVVEPSGGECDYRCVIGMVLVVTFWRATSISTLFKTIQSEFSLCVPWNCWRTFVCCVRLALHTTIWIILFVAFSRRRLLSHDSPTWTTLLCFRTQTICWNENEQQNKGCYWVRHLHFVCVLFFSMMCCSVLGEKGDI